ITNPMLRVTDVAAVAQLCQDRDAVLLVDNTFASPAVCRPLELGATLVMESVTKIINGHSDVMLGMLCGGAAQPWERIRQVASTWGFMASPFDCWLASRGLQTLQLRAEAACRGAAAVAEFLADRNEIAAVHYPGLSTHPDHLLARRQFGALGGSMVTIELASDPAEAARAATVERFILAAAEQGIPFCPSLGEIQTTLSHPASTSHRGHTAAELEQLGIRSTTIRLSIGIEPADQVRAALGKALAGTCK
ncbi:MAG: PLP-dependent transferase, partial [Pirellulales bacterium]